MKYTQDQAARFKRERDKLLEHVHALLQDAPAPKKKGPAEPQPHVEAARTYLREIGEL